MRRHSSVVCIALGLTATVLMDLQSAAQTAGSFFENKTITIGVGAAAGGGLDTYARLLSRHLAAHIPGAPSIVVSNMPGAGGQVVARAAMFSAPKDGTFIGTFFPSVLVDPLLAQGPRPLDPSRFTFIGNAKKEISVCMARRDLPLRAPSDLLTQTVTLGGTSPGSQAVDFPTVEKNLLGVKFNLISGYQGTREVGAAIEKGEVQGTCGVGWSTLKLQYPTLLNGPSFGKIIVQEDFKGDPELNAAGVPLLPSLATSDLQRQALRVLYAQNDLGRPYVAPPGVPQERVAVLQRAFMAALSDPELRADAARMRLDVDAMSGADLHAMIDALYATPKEVVETLSKAYGR